MARPVVTRSASIAISSEPNVGCAAARGAIATGADGWTDAAVGDRLPVDVSIGS
jgi:hypothetical protein